MRSTYLLFLFLFIFVCLPKSHVSLVFYLSSPIYLISTFFSSLSLFSSRVAQNGCWSFLRIKHIQVEHCEWSARSCPKLPEAARSCPKLPEAARSCPKLPEAWQCDQMTEQKIWPFFQTNRPKYLQQFLLKRTFFISPKSCQLFWLNLSSRPTKISQSGHTASCPTFRPGQHRPERHSLLNFFAISDTFLLKSHLRISRMYTSELANTSSMLCLNC